MTTTLPENKRHEKTLIETKVEHQLETRKLEKLKVLLSEKIQREKINTNRIAAA